MFGHEILPMKVDDETKELAECTPEEATHFGVVLTKTLDLVASFKLHDDYEVELGEIRTLITSVGRHVSSVFEPFVEGL